MVCGRFCSVRVPSRDALVSIEAECDLSIVYTTPERTTTEHVTDLLTPYFEMRYEVQGVHCVTGRKKWIDVVLIPRQKLLDARFPQIPVGLELKSFNLDDGNKKQAIEISKQAVDYRYTRFKMKSGYHFLPLILIYPPSKYYLDNSTSHEEEFKKGFEYATNRLLGKWFIGELFVSEFDCDFLIMLCGTRYFRWKKNKGFRWNQNWGFEKYEEVKRELFDKNLEPHEYEHELLKHTHLLGI